MAAEHDKKFWKRILFKHVFRPIWGQGIRYSCDWMIDYSKNCSINAKIQGIH